MRVGSSKPKPKPSKRKPSEAKRAVTPSTEPQPSFGDVVDALRAQQGELARITALIEDDAAARAALAGQCDRILELQQRTNTLLELALGAAFDFELEGPRRSR